ncbi:MAG: hypothetical protein CMLOHMNK_00538 [Steroidobacteraceae bacterium]|nr:hypothetical protein [Steroidobacteraceae bacterium]
MGQLEQAEAIRQLMAREAIRDCLMRYARAIDRMDRSLLEGVYWPEATDDHGSFSGTAAEFIDWVLPVLAAMEQTSHKLENILIELKGDDARTETYFEAYHRVPRAPEKPYDLVVGGRYVDSFQCRDGDWRIRSRVVIYDWMREYPDSADWSRPITGSQFKSGIRFRTNRLGTDASYALLGK